MKMVKLRTASRQPRYHRHNALEQCNYEFAALQLENAFERCKWVDKISHRMSKSGKIPLPKPKLLASNLCNRKNRRFHVNQSQTSLQKKGLHKLHLQVSDNVCTTCILWYGARVGRLLSTGTQPPPPPLLPALRADLVTEGQ